MAINGKFPEVVIRTFIALEIPAHFKEELGTIISKCKQIATKEVKWVEAKNLHFTLQFIGTIETNMLPLIEEKLTSILSDLHSFTIQQPLLEIYPNPFNNSVRNNSSSAGGKYLPRLIWVRCTYSDKTIEQKASAIRNMLQQLSLTIDNKPFKMHITLGRIKDRLSDKQIEQISALKLSERTRKINEATLYESRLHSYGPEYIKLKTYHLQEEDNG